MLIINPSDCLRMSQTHGTRTGEKCVPHRKNLKKSGFCSVLRTLHLRNKKTNRHCRAKKRERERIANGWYPFHFTDIRFSSVERCAHPTYRLVTACLSITPVCFVVLPLRGRLLMLFVPFQKVAHTSLLIANPSLPVRFAKVGGW